MRSLDPTKLVIIAAMLVVLGVPFLFRPASVTEGDAAHEVIIITPHNEQIRTEFAAAFADWHLREYGETARVIWNTPGGTSEIRRQLQSVYSKAIQDGQLRLDGRLAPGAQPMPQDIIFGGGTYEHGVVKGGVTVQLRGTGPVLSEALEGAAAGDSVDLAHGPEAGIATATLLEEGDVEVTMSMSVPISAWSEEELADLLGPNRIGPEGNHIYDPDRFWIGTATSGFGIVFNRDILANELGVPEPDSWDALCDPRLRGWVALADPRQSGSVATLYDSILNNLGWDEGWRRLREMSANARYFSNSSPKVPLDVSQGQAAIGVAIDFYGRYQAQAVMREGETPETSRVGYVDPAGQVFIDPDPISILRGGPNPQTAERFVRFVLSDEGQALWQFPARGEAAPASVLTDTDTWGPRRFELRRMPVRRDFIEANMERMVDRVNPFAIAADTENRGWRSSVGPMMAAFGIDSHGALKDAWEALSEARVDPGFPGPVLAEMERLFYAMPFHEFPDGERLAFSPENYGPIRNAWRNASEWRRAKIAYTTFFEQNYRRVDELRDHPDRFTPRAADAAETN